jgi:peptidyl-prolyl cis-trans isomerase A (cyclophilin A)
MMRALVVIAVLASSGVAHADPDGDTTAAVDAAKLFFLAISGSEASYVKDVLKAPVAYDRLRFEDPKCAKQFKGKGKVARARLGRFATCVLSLVRRTPAGELALTAGTPTDAGVVVVTAANAEVSYELTLAPAKDDTYRVTALRGSSAATSVVGPPEGGDLVEYTRGLQGKGALVATIATSMGNIRCELFEAKTPRAVANFVGLATGQKPWLDPSSGAVTTGTPFYDGLTFHRVIPGFIIQGGDPLGTGVGGPGYQWPDEIVKGVSNKAGTLAMANAGKDTNGSQFFINEVDNGHLDGSYTVFGMCADLGTVKAIAKVPAVGEKPKTPVHITHVTISRLP